MLPSQQPHYDPSHREGNTKRRPVPIGAAANDKGQSRKPSD